MVKRTTSNAEMLMHVWVPETKQLVEATFKGRVFVVGGREIVLYPISVMARAIGRTRETLILWEQNKTWPPPMWQVPDKRTKRWYSRAQILEVHRIHRELCKDSYGLSHTRYFNFKEFFKRVRAMWRVVDSLTITPTK